MSAILKTFKKNTRGRLGEVGEKEKDRDTGRETVSEDGLYSRFCNFFKFLHPQTKTSETTI